ncbi:very long chain fatty acid elongase F-like [Zophobas morio]|uniref:very long chain fatty acid elongase F-like n=1 Tax=Zophobas morio TaxID=2755281 RepID=UPI003082E90C
MAAFEPFIDGKTLMHSPQFCVMALLTYVLAVLLGPSFMKNRTAHSLKQVLWMYNLFQIILNVALLFKLLEFLPQIQKLTCIPPLQRNDIHVNNTLKAHYYYFLLKILDFADTLFMILRKRSHQISPLHVYHHISTFAVAWYSGVCYPGGYALLVGFWNTLVHAVMYGYYFLTSLKGSNQVSVTWKKYVTILQLIQHWFILCSVTSALFNPECTYSKKFLCVAVTNMVILICFFTKFYLENYVSVKKTTKSK